MGDYYKTHVGTMKFDKHSYDFELSDTSTYALLTNRFYVQLDDILLGNSKEVLDKYVEEKKFGETFMLTFSDVENNPIEMVCRMLPTDKPDVIEMDFCPLDSMFTMLENTRQELKEGLTISRQFGNTLFAYDARTGKITVGNDDKLPMGDEHPMDLDLFEADMRSKISETSYEELSNFLLSLRTGKRSFSASLTNHADGKKLNLTAVAVYDGCEHIRTVGRIGGSSMPQKQLSMYDQLKGVYMKGNIADYARRRIEEQHLRTGIAIIDLDNFKLVNDNYGHQKGDEVLRRAANIIAKCCKGIARVGTIGGDEFMVVYEDFDDIFDIRFTFMGMTSTMVNEFADMRKDGVIISMSTGCSVYPDDYDGNFDEMFKLADTFLYRAKDKGKDRYIVYNREKHGPVENLLKNGFEKINLDKSDYVCKLTDALICGTLPDIEIIIEDVLKSFGVERVMLYNKTDRFVKAHKGVDISFDIIRKTIRYLYDEGLTKEYTDGFMRINNIDHFATRAPEVHRKLVDQGVQSLQHFVVNGKSGKEYILSVEMLSSKCTWNKEDLQYYRIIVKVLEQIL